MAISAAAIKRLEFHIHNCPHDFAGKGVLNDLCGVLPKWYLPFESYVSVALTLGCKLASFCH